MKQDICSTGWCVGFIPKQIWRKLFTLDVLLTFDRKRGILAGLINPFNSNQAQHPYPQVRQQVLQVFQPAGKGK